LKGRAKRKRRNQGILYVGVDVHEKESQLVVLEKEGSLLMEKRIPTKKELGHETKITGGHGCCRICLILCCKLHPSAEEVPQNSLLV
jgi:hypothetical protein